MTRLLHYLTHPQVRIDPDIPVPDWGLNETGAARVRKLAQTGDLGGIARIWSSAERKAIETAEPLAKAANVPLEIMERMHENDRSATGFLPPPEFEEMANAFFARPDESVRGWERAIDAQARIVSATERAIADTEGSLLLTGHGGVGTLLYCHLAGLPIDRSHDQQGGGHFFTVDLETGRPRHGWRPMEDWPRA